jgi:hypothetical protein
MRIASPRTPSSAGRRPSLKGSTMGALYPSPASAEVPLKLAVNA